MSSTTQLVDSIANRLEVVVAQLNKYQSENESLQDRLAVLKQELEQKNNTIRELRMKLEAAKTAESIKGVGQNSTKAKTQIDKLINEIDTCLEFLSLS